MGRVAKRPLDPKATQAADDEFYANHPELVKNGVRQPLDPNDPNQAALRDEWMDLYVKHGGKLEGQEPPPKKPDEPCENCPFKPKVDIKDEVGVKAPCRLIHKDKTRKLKAVGTPEGGTYAWTASGKVSIVSGAASDVVEVKGNTASAAKEDSELTVTYTVKGKSAKDTIKLTVYEIKKIKVKVKATPRLTARAGHAAPNDHDFESTERAETFAADKTAVLMRGSLPDVELEAEVTPADVPVAWDVKRATDDAAALGAGKPTVTADGGNDKKAKLKTNETGSFYVRVFGDCHGDGKYTPDKGMMLLPVVLVEAALVADNSATHTAHINPAVAGGRFSLRTGSFNIGAPNTEAIHMNATADVRSGGPDGRRLLDRVFAGWINNERANEDIRGSYAGAHAVFSVFASNRASATGAGRTFVPGDPAPVLVAPPLLDSGRGGAGTGGETATLTRSRIRSRTDRAVGQRWIVESIDSPGDSAPMTHPAHGTRLQRYHFGLSFSAFLSFWTNRTGAAGATGDPADRRYACLRSYNWDMLGEWTVDAANNITVATAMSVTMSGKSTHNPLAENDDAGCEVRPPTGLSLLANDGRT